MDEQRFVVSDGLWGRLEPHLPGKARDSGVTAKDNRLFLEAVFWRVRSGSPWRDLPPGFGNWNSQFRRFRRWARTGVFESLFTAVSNDPVLEYALIDGTIVQVHQKAPGAKRGRSRGDLTTKIVALVDALGNLIRFLLLPGQAHDTKGVAPLIRDVSFEALLADKAFGAEWLLKDIDARGATTVVPSKAIRKQQRDYDKEFYKWRHLVENYLAKIKVSMSVQN